MQMIWHNHEKTVKKAFAPNVRLKFSNVLSSLVSLAYSSLEDEMPFNSKLYIWACVTTSKSNCGPYYMGLACYEVAFMTPSRSCFPTGPISSDFWKDTEIKCIKLVHLTVVKPGSTSPSCVIFFFPHAAVFVQGSLVVFHDAIKKVPPFYENTCLSLPPHCHPTRMKLQNRILMDTTSKRKTCFIFLSFCVKGK